MANDGDKQRTMAVGSVPPGYGSGSLAEWRHAEMLLALRRGVSDCAQTMTTIARPDNS